MRDPKGLSHRLNLPTTSTPSTSTNETKRHRGLALGFLVVATATAMTLVTACGFVRFPSRTPQTDPVVEPAPTPEPVACDLPTIGLETEGPFAASSLPTDFACAFCHDNGKPDLEGDRWGPDGVLTPEGWHAAVLSLAAKHIDDGDEHSLITHFDGSVDPGTHPLNQTALDAIVSWLEVFKTNGGDTCGAEAPVGNYCDEATTLAEVTTQGLTSTFECASCHQGGDPNARDIAWGPNGDTTDEGWNRAFRVLGTKEPARLVAALNGSIDSTHPDQPAAATAMQAWIASYIDDACSGIAPEVDGGVVVEPEDAGTPEPQEPDPVPVCEDPWEAAAQEAFFDANIKTQFLGCSGCHRGGAAGGGLTFQADAAYATAIERLNSEVPEESTLGRIFRIPDAVEIIMPNGTPHRDFADGDTALQDLATQFVSQAIVGVPRDTPECNVNLCDITPLQSETLFNETLLSEFVSCSSCHRAVAGPSNGNLQFDTPNAYAVAIERLDTSLSPTANIIGQILQVDGSVFPNHAFNFTASGAAEDWIEANIDGLPCDE